MPFEFDEGRILPAREAPVRILCRAPLLPPHSPPPACPLSRVLLCHWENEIERNLLYTLFCHQHTECKCTLRARVTGESVATTLR